MGIDQPLLRENRLHAYVERGVPPRKPPNLPNQLVSGTRLEGPRVRQSMAALAMNE